MNIKVEVKKVEILTENREFLHKTPLDLCSRSRCRNFDQFKTALLLNYTIVRELEFDEF